MGQMKSWGAQIARMLFDQHMTVDQVFQRLNTPWTDADGIQHQPDERWLREQIKVVKDNPELWTARNAL